MVKCDNANLIRFLTLRPLVMTGVTGGPDGESMVKPWSNFTYG